MGLFHRQKKLDPVLAKLDGRLLQSVARRDTDENGNPQEIGLGQNGRINTANGHVLITCGEKEVFLSRRPEAVTCGETLSLKGAIFTGFNELTGQTETIVVQYDSLYRQ